MTIDGRNTSLYCVETSGIVELPDLERVAAERDLLTQSRPEWNHTVIVFNHDKNRPLKQRCSEPFSETVLQFAGEAGFTLITAMDLYRFVRAQRELGWQIEKPEYDFLKPGRQYAHPMIYQRVGIVKKMFPNLAVASIDLDMRVKSVSAIRLPLNCMTVLLR
jgi:hypothetical protein